MTSSAAKYGKTHYDRSTEHQKRTMLRKMKKGVEGGDPLSADALAAWNTLQGGRDRKLREGEFLKNFQDGNGFAFVQGPARSICDIVRYVRSS